MNNVSELLDGVATVGIAGHIRPDGDCVGSCLALYGYLRKYWPGVRTDIYLEKPSPDFRYLDGFSDIQSEAGEDRSYDLFILCDVSSADRIGVASAHFGNAKKTACIDHHISNTGLADINHVVPETGSACEVLYHLLDRDRIDREIAEALFTGMVHDTGVFQYTCTTPDTLRTAAVLMEKGVDFSRIIEETFYEKTYLQNQVMGRVLAESIMLFGGRCIVGFLRRRDMDFYGVTPLDLDGIVSQLRLTKGVLAAVFIYELEPQVFKVSLRANGETDVSRIAAYFGGGGHVKAAGCSLTGSVYDVISNVAGQVEAQFMEMGVL